jgi:hypothetical protein
MNEVIGSHPKKSGNLDSENRRAAGQFQNR